MISYVKHVACIMVQYVYLIWIKPLSQVYSVLQAWEVQIIVKYVVLVNKIQ